MVRLTVYGRRAAALLLVPVVLAACDTRSSQSDGEVAGNWQPRNPDEVLGVPNAAVRTAVEQRLAGKAPERIDKDEWKHVKAIYSNFDGAPLWLSADGLDKTRTKALADALLNASSDGMKLSAFPIGELARVIASVRESSRPTAEQLAEADVLLTSAYTALAEDLLTGQVDPKSVAQSWHIDPSEEAVDSALVRTIRVEALDEAIAGMRPVQEEYAQLQKELDRYRQIVVNGGWPTVPDGRAVRPGETDKAARMAVLRTRLAAEGLLAQAPSGQLQPTQQSSSPQQRPARAAAQPGAGRALYDSELAGAVALFQTRHGIVVDSMLGPQTLQSLNRSAEERLVQIAANLERYRWLPRAFGDRYIFVNVAGFRVQAYDQGKKELDMKVIVGAEYDDRSTPVFADEMTHVVFRPYWNVTPDIQRKEIEPKIAADPSYMARNRYEYWTDGGVRRVRQKPGDENSLGLVKFMFPNNFNIYLHDTPQRELFKKDQRALSHGCIRLEKPAEMAQWVLGWDAEKVRQAMHSGKNDRHVKLPKKIPVYIAYFTTYMQDGALHFGSDIYDRDRALGAAMLEGAMPSPQSLEAVQALRRIADSI